MSARDIEPMWKRLRFYDTTDVMVADSPDDALSGLQNALGLGLHAGRCGTDAISS